MLARQQCRSSAAPCSSILVGSGQGVRRQQQQQLSQARSKRSCTFFLQKDAVLKAVRLSLHSEYSITNLQSSYEYDLATLKYSKAGTMESYPLCFAV